MGDIFYFPDPRNQDKIWDIFINQYIFPLDYVKLYIRYIKDPKWVSKTDKYMVHNLTW